MCGIFGIILKDGQSANLKTLKNTVNNLFTLSESRGKESAGIALRTGSAIYVYKEPVSASEIISSNNYGKLYSKAFNKMNFSEHVNGPLAIIGHSRLVTNGVQSLNDNNQPVIKDGIVGVHNGIVVNNNELWKEFHLLKRKYEVDTEIVLSLVRQFYNEKKSLIRAVQNTFKKIFGSASVALLLGDSQEVVLATNTGSLFICMNKKQNICVFASERYILEMLMKKKFVKRLLRNWRIEQLKPGHGCLINMNNLNIQRFGFNDKIMGGIKEQTKVAKLKIIDTSFQNYKPQSISSLYKDGTKLKKLLVDNSHLISKLRRCTKCILPETFPYIKFDKGGVCNYCNNYKRIKPKGEEALKKILAPHRSKDGSPDCIVAFSGGRDSSYMLHYLKKNLKMNPITFTYDWGMITDLARRNQARLCGKLGVEHVLMSADIIKKRSNIKKNVKAWLKKPDLGMSPLLMAGDKQFYYYANRLMKQTGVKLIFFGVNPFEKTDFKSGFCKIKPQHKSKHAYTLSMFNKIKLAVYYGKRFISNWSYINSSILDTIFGFFSYYMMPFKFLNIYDYIPWEEKKINDILINEYKWELATDTDSLWRIGDGTAAFYNYIYYTLAGFTENDTFRSIQVREGILTRKKALELTNEENKPRFETIMWYTRTVGFDYTKAINIINSWHKLYKK